MPRGGSAGAKSVNLARQLVNRDGLPEPSQGCAIRHKIPAPVPLKGPRDDVPGALCVLQPNPWVRFAPGLFRGEAARRRLVIFQQARIEQAPQLIQLPRG